MSDHIILGDGRAWKASSQLTASLLRESAGHVPARWRSVADWLIDRSEMPNGLIGFDVRAFDERVRAIVVDAVRAAAHEMMARALSEPGPSRRLLEMLDSVTRGDAPELLNDFSETVAFSDERIVLRPRDERG